LAKLAGLEYRVEDLLFVPAVEIDPKEELVQLLVAEASEVMGERPEVRGVGPWNDAWMYVTRDIPTICGFGPDGEGAHQEGEWVSLKSLKKVTEIYARLAMAYLGVKEA
jgi:acetylornithine deacetylase/succinyl-diaminopimelate desuccinylase-like protein